MTDTTLICPHGCAPSPVEPRPARRAARAPGRRVRGLYARLLGFVSVFLALWLAVFFGRNLLDTWLARSDFRRAVHPDRSVAENAVRSQVRSRVALVYRDQDGRRVRVLADQEAFSRFVQTSVGRLEAARMVMQGGLSRRVDRVLAPTFGDLHGRVGEFAEWYFAWGTSYRLMARAAGAAANNFLGPSAMDVSDAVGYELSQYLQARYQAIVLRPELTDPRLQQDYLRTLARLHGEYLHVMAELDWAFQAFVAAHTTHLEEPLDAREVGLTVDWDSHRHKLSIAGYERGGMESARGVGLAAAGALIGRTVVAAPAGKAAGAATRGLMARLAAPYAGRLATTAGGAGVGAFGGPVGAVIGGAAGLGIDYLVNEGVELVQRDEFEMALHEGLDVTRQQLQGVMERSLSQAVQVWFDDTLQLLVVYD